MNIKFSNTLRMTAIAVLVSASYASAAMASATIKVTVNDNVKPESMILVSGQTHKWDFLGKYGEREFTVTNKIYPPFGIKFQGLNDKTPVIYLCKKSEAPNAPGLGKVDLKENDASLSLIVKYDEAAQKIRCYKAEE